jgi:hypothetical protein
MAGGTSHGIQTHMPPAFLAQRKLWRRLLSCAPDNISRWPADTESSQTVTHVEAWNLMLGLFDGCVGKCFVDSSQYDTVWHGLGPSWCKCWPCHMIAGAV